MFLFHNESANKSRPQGKKLSACNILSGIISNIISGAVNNEITIELPGDNTVTSIIKASDVLLAVA